MTCHKLAFLIGGSAAHEEHPDGFLAAAGGRAARIALLLQGGEGWERYLPFYTDPWTQRGVTQYQAVAPGPDGVLDLEQARRILQWATAIYVGGGRTPTYHQLYASGPVGALITERHEQGVPYAGLSAGAVLAMEACVFEPSESADGKLQVVPGLGLLKGWVIGVHFTSQNALPEMLEVMARTRTPKGLGIDDEACAVFNCGRFVGVLGHSVYEIEMPDFEQRAYRTTECKIPYARTASA